MEEVEEIPLNPIQSAIVKFVRSDTVLAICLSTWVTLALMIFVEPELSKALCLVSLLLVVIYRLMTPARKKRPVVELT